MNALVLLLWLRLRGRVRAFARGLRRPSRLALLVVALVAVAFVAWTGLHGRSSGAAQGQKGVLPMACFLLGFATLATWASTRHGVIAFRPEEVHFLFPAPVTSRALLLTHVVTATVKAATGSFFFAVFLRPNGMRLLPALAGYGSCLVALALLQVRVDLSCLHLNAADRRRRARIVLLGLAGGLAAAVGAAFLLDGGVAGERLLRFALLPVAPFVAVITGAGAAGAPALHLLAAAWLTERTAVLLVLGIIAALAGGILAFRGDLREAAHTTSLTLHARIERIRRGRGLIDVPRALSGGRVLPMLPRLGGAGVHAWRQLTVLSRSRKSYLLLVFMTIFMGLSVGTALEPGGEKVATAMLAFMIFVGPMYVQCDFRADYECLAWLRTLPTPPAILAAGQMLASSLVLYVLQLLLTGWVLVACPSAHRLAWAGVFLVLPVFNLLQLSVWNGFHLLYPVRLAAREGSPPGAVQVVRLYLVFFAVYAVVALAVAVGAALGALAWVGSGWAGSSHVQARMVFAGVAGFAALCAMTTACVWCVGRIFVRVDPARDLTD